MFTPLPGDAIHVRTNRTIVSGSIRAAQRRKNPEPEWKEACTYNHSAWVGTPGIFGEPYVISADFPYATRNVWQVWKEDWLSAEEDYMIVKRMCLTDDQRLLLGRAYDTFEGKLYDGRTLLDMGRAYYWFPIWRWYAWFITRHMKRTPNSITCSEMGIRGIQEVPDVLGILLQAGGQELVANPEAVSPAQLVMSSAWTKVWDSRENDNGLVSRTLG